MGGTARPWPKTGIGMEEVFEDKRPKNNTQEARQFPGPKKLNPFLLAVDRRQRLSISVITSNSKRYGNLTAQVCAEAE